eukprot:5359932-Pyramimonas_sp.AAC.1
MHCRVPSGDPNLKPSLFGSFASRPRASPRRPSKFRCSVSKKSAKPNEEFPQIASRGTYSENRPPGQTSQAPPRPKG